ncbi:MAG: glycyl-radical enzyme activating protein [Treponema sp.]|nr:glycyl-radical enzyme activating protein [Treponema sp.]
MTNNSEKEGFVFDIQRFSTHDGPGIRTTIFLKGCNMRCPWCHNPESFAAAEGGEQLKTVDEIMTEIIKDKKYYHSSGGGITFSGGEPTMQFPFLLNLLNACKENDIQTALETNGLFPVTYLHELFKKVDIFLFDIKHTDDKEHLFWTGVSNTEILENLSKLCKNNSKVILRCPIIPDINNNDTHFQALAILKKKNQNIKSIDLMPYHNIGSDKWEKYGLVYKFKELPSASAEQKNMWQKRLDYFLSI